MKYALVKYVHGLAKHFIKIIILILEKAYEISLKKKKNNKIWSNAYWKVIRAVYNVLEI